MKLPLFIASAATALTLGTASVADQVLASDPQSLVNFFFNNGYPAQLTTDAVGDPMVEYRLNGSKEVLFFYDCEDNTDCLAVQFYSGYQLDNSVSLERINEWNSGDRRFIRAYLTEDGAARIEMDVATSADGISERDFNDLLSLWIDRMAEFEEFIGW
ncbi:MAG: YbjN domain-containing protein [Desulfobacterales bacterium]